jgi:hypothetical protein
MTAVKPRPRVVEAKVIADTATLTIGNGQLTIAVPKAMNGAILQEAHAFVSTASTSGLPTVQIRNVTQGANMLSTAITIDANEFTSYTAATPPVVDAAHKTVSTGDLIAVDVSVAGTGTKGLGVILTFS